MNRQKLKSPEQIEQMRRAGRVVYQALSACRAACRIGATTADLEAAAASVLQEHDAIGLFKGYPHPAGTGPAFPTFTCISVNDEVVHGIPGDRVIADGDIVSIDFGAQVDGWCGDSATTIMVGRVPKDVRRLCEVTEHVLQIAIENIKPGRRWSEIAGMMENYAKRQGFGVIRDYVGHGIGRSMHEPPQIPNFVSRQLRINDIRIEAGMVLAIEPMCTLGSDHVQVLADGWTVSTVDRKAAAHYEHTVAVTEHGADVLTDGR